MAEHLGITKQAAAQIVGHLVANGYVMRQPDLTDARAQLLVAHPAGVGSHRRGTSRSPKTPLTNGDLSWMHQLSLEFQSHAEDDHPTRKAWPPSW